MSDVTRAVDRLGRVAAGKAMVALRREQSAVVAGVRRMSRRDSDAALESCRSTALGIEDQAKDR